MQTKIPPTTPMHLEVEGMNIKLFVEGRKLPDKELAKGGRPLMNCDV